jgi:hypothetical protein
VARHRSILFWALAGLSLLVSHDAVYLFQIGPGAELASILRGAAHEYWGFGSALLTAIGALVVVGTLLRLRGLRRKAEDLAIRPTRSYPRRVLRTWAWLLAVVAVGFVIQESAEHVIAHGHAIGAGALLSAEYPLSLPVITAITGLAALIVALAADVEHQLLAAIASALKPPRPRSAVLRPSAFAPLRASVRSRPGASRAPPVLFAT